MLDITAGQVHPLRVRTVTAFLQLPPVSGHWESEIAAAGAFLAFAKQKLEALGYEVQTTRIATQPFPLYLYGNRSSHPNSNTPAAAHSVLVSNAVQLEGIAAKHGIGLVSIGSSSDPADLAVIPHILAATVNTSCSFHLPADADMGLCQQVAAAIMQIAALTGGMGNFRFASASAMVPGVPYFPVACVGGPQQHHTFALGTESDTLLHQAFAAAAAGAAVDATASKKSYRAKPHILQEAAQQLHQLLLQHLQPLEQAALAIEAAVTEQQQQQNGADVANSNRPSVGAGFKYLGLDSSIAPGLDTPALTASYELLGYGRFGAAGSLTVSSMITNVLKQLPLQLTGYCGLMLAVCEDQGLAAAAAAGSITISKLLHYSAVCGCGLDTVPVPGPAAIAGREPEAEAGAAPLDTQEEKNIQESSEGGIGTGFAEDTAAAAPPPPPPADAHTTSSIAALVSDTNTLAYRLGKPLACRLLPLPGKSAGEPTGFNHPYMINSHVMDLNG